MGVVHKVIEELRKDNTFYGQYVIRFPHATMMINQCKADPNAVFLTSIYVDEDSHGKGEGKRAMKALQRAAALHNVHIHLIPHNFDRSVPMSYLKGFYGSLGFFPVGSRKWCWVPGLLPE